MSHRFKFDEDWEVPLSREVCTTFSTLFSDQPKKIDGFKDPDGRDIGPGAVSMTLRGERRALFFFSWAPQSAIRYSAQMYRKENLSHAELQDVAAELLATIVQNCLINSAFPLKRGMLSLPFRWVDTLKPTLLSVPWPLHSLVFEGSHGRFQFQYHFE